MWQKVTAVVVLIDPACFRLSRLCTVLWICILHCVCRRKYASVCVSALQSLLSSLLSFCLLYWRDDYGTFGVSCATCSYTTVAQCKAVFLDYKFVSGIDYSLSVNTSAMVAFEKLAKCWSSSCKLHYFVSKLFFGCGHYAFIWLDYSYSIHDSAIPNFFLWHMHLFCGPYSTVVKFIRFDTFCLRKYLIKCISRDLGVIAVYSCYFSAYLFKLIIWLLSEIGESSVILNLHFHGSTSSLKVLIFFCFCLYVHCGRFSCILLEVVHIMFAVRVYRMWNVLIRRLSSEAVFVTVVPTYQVVWPTFT